MINFKKFQCYFVILRMKRKNKYRVVAEILANVKNYRTMPRSKTIFYEFTTRN